MEILRLLVVAFDYPPYVGGGGSIRMHKLVKYLSRDNGFKIHVLTGGWESRDADPTVSDDNGLVSLHVANPNPVTPVSRNQPPRKLYSIAGLLLRAILQMPDNRFRFLWRMSAEIMRLSSAHRFDVVLITSPPNSMGLLAPLLKRSGLKASVVLDYRDMWALDPLLVPSGSWFRKGQCWLEKWAIKHADALIAVTPGYVEWLQSQCGKHPPVTLLTNGYDEEDFTGLVPSRVINDGILISYAGSLGGINGPRNVGTLKVALSMLQLTRPDIASRLVFQFIGIVPINEQHLLLDAQLASRFIFTGYLPHKKTLAMLAGSDALMIIHFNLPHSDRIYPGKLFEYYRLGLPVLALSPPGCLCDFITSRKIGETAHVDQPEALANALITLVDNIDTGSKYSFPGSDLEAFERGKIAVQYGELLRGMGPNK